MCLVARPELSGLNVSTPQLLPRIVGLLDNLGGSLLIQILLIESETWRWRLRSDLKVRYSRKCICLLTI